MRAFLLAALLALVPTLAFAQGGPQQQTKIIPGVTPCITCTSGSLLTSGSTVGEETPASLFASPPAYGSTTPAAVNATTLSATGAASLTGTGTALNVPNGVASLTGGVALGTGNVSGTPTWAAGQTFPSITTGGTLSVTGHGNTVLLGTSGVGNATNIIAEGNQPVGFGSGSNGMAFYIYGASSAITGRLNYTPGTANGPDVFNTGNSSFSHTSIAFQDYGTNAQTIFGNLSLNGAWTVPASSTSNCGGQAGLFLVCDPNGDTAAYGYASGPGNTDSFRVYRVFGGSGTTGSREAAGVYLNLDAPTSDTQTAFYQAFRTETDINATAGGTSSDYMGDFFSGNSYASLHGNYYVNSVGAWEFDLDATAGATTHQLNGVSVVLLSNNAVGGDQSNYAYTLGAQAGAVPTLTCGYCFGTIDGVNGLASNASLMGFLLPNDSGAGPTVAYGDDFRLATFTGSAFATNGGDVFGNGSVRIGRTYLTDTSSGLTITPTGSVGASATVASGGSGYTANGTDLTDAYGGIWEATVSGGVVTAVTMLRAPAVSGTPPTNPIALTSPGTQAGTGATINVTWAAGTETNFVGGIATGGTAGVTSTTCTQWTNGLCTHS